jgi:hypothetical protein
MDLLSMHDVDDGAQGPAPAAASSDGAWDPFAARAAAPRSGPPAAAAALPRKAESDGWDAFQAGAAPLPAAAAGLADPFALLDRGSLGASSSSSSLPAAAAPAPALDPFPAAAAAPSQPIQAPSSSLLAAPVPMSVPAMSAGLASDSMGAAAAAAAPAHRSTLSHDKIMALFDQPQPEVVCFGGFTAAAAPTTAAPLAGPGTAGSSAAAFNFGVFG